MSYADHPTEFCPHCEEEYKVHEPDPSCHCGWDPRNGTGSYREAETDNTQKEKSK